MKNLSKLLFAVVFLFGATMINAQDKNNPWAAGIGANAVDFYPVGEPMPQGNFLDEYFNVEDHWNILPSISRLSIGRYLGDNFTFSAIGTINQIKVIGSNVSVTGVETQNRVPNLTYYGVDGMISYSFQDIIKSNSIDPYLGVGGGYTWVDDIGGGTVNGSLGLNYWFNKSLGLNVQSSYKYGFEDYLASHLQHSVGVIFKFGGSDRDGDGIYDDEDACPDTSGLEAFMGCPDSDGDGIEDKKDDCPNTFGLAEYNGCPDTDGDGVVDKDDKCPETPGLKDLMGCPDADGDGVIDSEDNCKDTPGPAANNGCPWPDTDGDGVLDKDDKCPDVAGLVELQGCPKEEPTIEEIKEVNVKYTRSILFDTGRSTIKEESNETIDYIVNFLKKYPKAKFTVDGYTDSVGSAKNNQKLSEKRAKAVRDALVEGGIDAGRISSFGYGEDNPIADNKTRAGRAQNRRVEITLQNK